MSISVTCEICGESYSVRDDAAGKKIRCRSCGKAIAVGGSAADEPEDWEPEPKPARPAVRKPSSRTSREGSGVKRSAWMMPLIGLGVVFLMCSGILFVVVRAVRKTADVVVLKSKDAAQRGNVVPTNDVPPAGGKVDAPPSDESRVAWTARIDPPAQKVEWPANLDVAIPMDRSADRVAISAPGSRFVAVNLDKSSKSDPEVWDVVAGERKGTIASEFDNDINVLSFDGEHLLSVEPGSSSRVQLWACATGEEVKLPAEIESATIHNGDFAGADRVVLWGEKPPQVVVIDVAKGTVLKKFAAPRPRSRHAFLGVSPGGNFVALGAEAPGVAIYDLRTGKLAGRVMLGQGKSALQATGVAFSADGAQLACLFEEAERSTLVAADMASGKTETVFSSLGKLADKYSHAFSYEGRPIAALPDRSGWLLYGAAFLDGRHHEIVWLAPHRLEGSVAPVRIAVPGGLLAVSESKSKLSLKRFEIPWAKIDDALAKPADPGLLHFGPGTPVKIEVKLGALVHGGQPGPTRQRLEAALRERIQSAGAKVSDDAAATVVRLEYAEQVGPLFQFQQRGAGSGRRGPISVASTKTTATLSIVPAGGGKAIHESPLRGNSRSFFPEGEPTPGTLRDDAIDEMVQEIRSLILPRTISKSGSDVSIPGTTRVR